MPDQSSVSTSLLGFLVVEPTTKGDGFISAVMVTDGRGYPLEFKATTPVRPSLVQKTLYGATLEKYVGIELCGKSLVRQLSRKPIAILVPDRNLLDMAPDVAPAVIAVWRPGEQLSVVGDDTGAHGTIKPPEGISQPLVYDGRFRDPSQQTDALRFVEDCSMRFDVVEAFDRMREALKLLPKEDKRYA